MLKLALSAVFLSLLLSACVSDQPLSQAEPAPASSAPASATPIFSSASSSSTSSASPRSPRSAGNSKLASRINSQRMRAQLQQGNQPINIRHSCSFKNETGYKGSTRIEISNNEVRQLSTAYEIPAQGSCQIDFRGFRQTRHSPSIELRHADGCTARIWTQGRQLTVSYTQCAQRCSSAQTFRFVWPVLIDQPSGRCD